MLFYLALIGILLVSWVILASFLSIASVVSVSVFGVATFIVVLIAVRHSYYERGRKKEMYYAIALILLYYLRSYIRAFVIGGYNALFSVVVTQLNNRGVTKINIDQSSWKLDSTGQILFDILIFFVGGIAAYVFTEGMAGPKGKDIFGAILGGLAATLFMTFAYILLQPYLGSVYSTNLLNGATVNLPDIRLPTLRVQSQTGNRSPLPGWDTWLPLLVVGIVLIYFLFFVKPFTKTKPGQAGAKRDTFKILAVALLIAFTLAAVVGLIKPIA